MTHNDTKLEWTDADLADAIYHANEAGAAKALEQLREKVSMLVAQAAGQLHEIRVDGKQYPIQKARYEALAAAFSTLITTAIKIDGKEDCNCDEEVQE
jgi:hypothetical protein